MDINDIDIDKMTDAIEKDAGQKIDGLKESITEMKTHMKRFDQAKHIDINDPDFIRKYLEVMLDENGIEGFLRGLGNVEKATSMSQITNDTTFGK